MKKQTWYHSTLFSPIGNLQMLRSKRGLTHILFDAKELRELVAKTKKKAQVSLIRDDRRFQELKSDLKKYFAGKRVKFKNGFDLSGATSFQKKVWRAMTKIPAGQTRSYQWLAEKVGIKSPRAVGQACGSNPISVVIPCHRVIAKNGDLGGYGGGLKRKVVLLKLEGAMNG